MLNLNLNPYEINADYFQTARKLQIVSLMIRPVPSGITLTSYRSIKHRLKRNFSIKKNFQKEIFSEEDIDNISRHWFTD